MQDISSFFWVYRICLVHGACTLRSMLICMSSIVSMDWQGLRLWVGAKVGQSQPAWPGLARVGLGYMGYMGLAWVGQH